MIYDVVIVGAGAAGLFSGICLKKDFKKIILEKTAKPGTKVLMSGGERANVSNADIEPTRDYFTQNKKFLHSIFSKYTNWDIMSFFAESGVEIVEEDRSRLILKSGDSRELLNCLLQKLKKNNCPIKLNFDVKNILKTEKNIFEIEDINGEKIFSKNVIISSGGKSFPQVGTTGEGYNIAKSFDLEIISPYRTLCGMATKRDLSEISGVSVDLQMKLFDKNFEKKVIYSENGPLLFTHFGISGPIVHNLSNAIGEYLNSKKILEIDFEKYILENLFVELKFDLEKTPKRVLKFFDLSEEKKIEILELQNWRSWKEAKATGGGISTGELDNHMQAKKIPGLYFVGEVVDVTGKTGGFNLQWAWSSAFVASENINKNIF
ncbi:aminoacetone oxidase family FAD-binding enzyme [Candidatus Gracilibacteria bacterium]|nr:MAG: aminoacetone oxidase family FAD-binding enzyme [Candidatus Gracilibacteria bacterium]